MSVVSSVKLAPYVLALAAVGDFGGLNCQPTIKVDRSAKFQLTTSPPLRQTPVSGSFSICIHCLLTNFACIS